MCDDRRIHELSDALPYTCVDEILVSLFIDRPKRVAAQSRRRGIRRRDQCVDVRAQRVERGRIGQVPERNLDSVSFQMLVAGRRANTRAYACAAIRQLADDCTSELPGRSHDENLHAPPGARTWLGPDGNFPAERSEVPYGTSRKMVQ